MKPLALISLFLLAAAPAVAPAVAHAADPAADRIQAFDAALLETMKQGKALGPQGRYRKLEPAVEAAFDLPTMTGAAVGPAEWSKISPSDQAKLIAAFKRVNVGNWARNFDEWDGERFQVGKVDTRGVDKLVRNQLIPRSGPPVDLNYRMREAGAGGWRIVDVYYNGAISSIATQRSDYASALKAGGAAALLKKLDAQGDALMKGK